MCGVVCWKAAFIHNWTNTRWKENVLRTAYFKVSNTARALSSLPGRLVDTSLGLQVMKPWRMSLPIMAGKGEWFEECYLYIMSTYICICAILSGMSQVCMYKVITIVFYTSASNVHSCLFVFSTQLWSGINSWFWHTPWVSTKYCTSIDGFTPFSWLCIPQKFLNGTPSLVPRPLPSFLSLAVR